MNLKYMTNATLRQLNVKAIQMGANRALTSEFFDHVPSDQLHPIPYQILTNANKGNGDIVRVTFLFKVKDQVEEMPQKGELDITLDDFFDLPFVDYPTVKH